MSALDTARNKIESFTPGYGTSESARDATKAQTLVASGLVAQAEEQRIANLIALLPTLDAMSTRTVMSDLSARLGLSDLALETEG